MSKNKIVIIGNWKMNKKLKDVENFIEKFNSLRESENIESNIIYGFAVPSVYLSTMGMNDKFKNNIIAAQNFYKEDFGAYTGEISSEMIKSVGGNAVLIGHSERRDYFQETNQLLNSKLIQALKNKLQPIFCIGESLKERKNDTWKDILTKQLEEGLKNLSNKDIQKTIIAYEPIWAIGTGVTATSEEAEEACKFVREIISKITNKNIANKVVIQYGGSVKPNNIEELMNMENINGALVGGASLEPESFLKLLKLNK